MLVSLRFPNLSDDLFRKLARKYLKEHKHDSLQMSDFKNEHEYLLLDTTCSSQFTVSLEFHPREQLASPNRKCRQTNIILLRQIEGIVYTYNAYTSTQVLPLLLCSEQSIQSCPYHICNCWFRDKDIGLERLRKTSSGDLCPVPSRL